MKEITTINNNDLAIAKEIIDNCDTVLIGAGTGLSAAAGFLTDDFETFKRLFPGYTRRYGLRTVAEAVSFYFPSAEEHYAFLARYISAFRCSTPPEDVYTNLLDMVKSKPHFVITTTTDGQFVNAGFEKQRIYSPHGDLSFFQCSMPCTKKLVPNRKMVELMLDDLSENPFAIRSSNIPTCPRCGSFLEPNILESVNFNSIPWMQKSTDYIDFLRNSVKGKLVLLELGVGSESSTIIRYPFEYIAANYKNSILIRVNLNDYLTEVPFADKQTLSYRIDIKEFCSSVTQYV
ncbi:NAD-dependent protein deacetylase of SIR2 family [Aquipluma nitroreducens]|uniref:NAD-dependent protein deacetylase of SIR2 family n=1 Tax=Aquipluma nitroreducens TaxID=2010828 RepID=A0A5K7S8X5_9BACT|nr:hypothetical protein [Aquipluma nitroreducens]BBE18000.1 NAD-dependent protein deacetylase of SIR2 family [Aquipluma nitroreducens]